MNRLHAQRWKSQAFTGARLSFHQDLSRRLAARGELFLSRLWVNDEVVSVLYDIRKGCRQYNLKLGFDCTRNRKVSLGLLHFGYAMEQAAHAGVTTYDFLAGTGKTTDFKSHLGREQHVLSTVQLMRGRLLPRLYRLRDRRRVTAT